MIRDRRPEDLDRLSEVLDALPQAVGVLAGRSPRAWLEEFDAERSWVFDQAPVSVAPTRNVVGHVQIYRSPDEPWLHEMVVPAGVSAAEVLVIGRLFVKPVKHANGIARYLLKEAATYVEARGCLAVVDPSDVTLVPEALPAKAGFRELRTGPEAPFPISADKRHYVRYCGVIRQTSHSQSFDPLPRRRGEPGHRWTQGS